MSNEWGEALLWRRGGREDGGSGWGRYWAGVLG